MKLVTPKINYTPYAELKAKEPDCTVQINLIEQMFISGSGVEQESACVEGLRCYSEVKRFWEGYYRILDSKVQILNAGDE